MQAKCKLFYNIYIPNFIAPFGPDYLHHRTGEDNGDAHLKSILVHDQIIVPVTGGDRDLGPWQQIFYDEFDGRRKKRVIIKVTFYGPFCLFFAFLIKYEIPKAINTMVV